MKLRDSETKAAVNEAEIKNMELHLQNKMFEQVSPAAYRDTPVSERFTVFTHICITLVVHNNCAQRPLINN